MARLSNGGAPPPPQLRDLYTTLFIAGFVLLMLSYANNSSQSYSYRNPRGGYRGRHGYKARKGVEGGNMGTPRGASLAEDGEEDAQVREMGHVPGGDEIVLPDVYDNVADLVPPEPADRPRNDANDVDPKGAPSEEERTERYSTLPLFWHVPRSAGTTLRDLASHCLGLVTASDAGLRGELGPEHGSREELYVVRSEGGKYVNVDTATRDGLERGRGLGLVRWMRYGGGGELVVSPRVWDAAGMLFDPTAQQQREHQPGHASAQEGGDGDEGDGAAAPQVVQVAGQQRRQRRPLRIKARLFALFRHPVHRSASLFHHLRSASPSDPHYNPDLAIMEITDWAKTDAFVNNFVTRSLVDKLDPPGQLLALDDLNAAKEILRRKVLVGIVEDKSESVRRFERYLGWDRPGFRSYSSKQQQHHGGGAALSAEGRDECRSKLLHWGWSNKNRHPEVEEGSEAWELLRRKNLFDVELYLYARFLFDEQGGMLETGEMRMGWEAEEEAAAAATGGGDGGGGSAAEEVGAAR